ncbi:MAG: hypothetical protein M1839_000703 [Geoglossum umbratile]|nr:MAG: hypothetical protein M1839_000703 [Geoglossum umbratile]
MGKYVQRSRDIECFSIPLRQPGKNSEALAPEISYRQSWCLVVEEEAWTVRCNTAAQHLKAHGIPVLLIEGGKLKFHLQDFLLFALLWPCPTVLLPSAAYSSSALRPQQQQGYVMANKFSALLITISFFFSLLPASVNAILGNEASVLLCSTGINSNCGIWVTYTNTKVRQTVSAKSFFSLPCAVLAGTKHTNSDGFWTQANLLGPNAGYNIGYNPNRRQINLGKATKISRDPAYLNGRCANEFGWRQVDADLSQEAFYGDIPTYLIDP